MKKLFALIASFAMVFTLLVSGVSAANITIENGASGSVYSAWRLLDATDGSTETETIISYTVNENYKSILQEVTEKETDSEIISYISGLDKDGIRTFADKVYAKIKGIDADATSKDNVFEDVNQGYYLIAETTLGSNGDNQSDDTYSLVMLNTAGQKDITVTTKEGVPTLEKKVIDKNDTTDKESGWQDSADHDLNDVIKFKLTGTVSEKYDDYKTYYYAFHDKMDPGLTFNSDSVVVRVDGNEITDGYEVITDGLTDGCTFEVVFDDLKAIDDVNANSEITVEYTASLNENAVLGSAGNLNKAKLEYNNNPYYEAEGKPVDTGETPWDKVIVFTYQVIVNKIDSNNKPLNGASFKLEKKNSNNEYELVKKFTLDDDLITFTFTHLDDGDYKLTEVDVPTGYNKIDPIEFTVSAEHDEEKDDPKLISLTGNVTNGEITLTPDLTAGSLTGNVINTSGSLLPTTGGMGTTLFYVVGAILVAGAAFIVIKRKKAEE